MEKLSRYLAIYVTRRHLLTPKTKTFAETLRNIHVSNAHLRDQTALQDGKKREIQSDGIFEEFAKTKKQSDKVSFQTAVAFYITKEKLYRRGHVEFIYAALKKMKEFGVERDLSAYKALLEVFPKEKMIPKSMWQVEFMHYPRQQQCAIDIMEQMEDNGIIPDHQFGVILAQCFGQNAHAFRKYRRVMYWLPKFRNANPYPVPFDLPDDAIQLAMLALKRMSIDYQNSLTVWKTSETEVEPIEDTFIVSAMSPEQQDLIKDHPVSQPLFVEGGYLTWMRNICQTYFILRADPDLEKFTAKPPVKRNEDEEDLFEWKTMFEEERPKALDRALSVHEQSDGTVLGMCITGSGSKDSLVTWIRYLQRANPRLEKIPIVFSMKSPESEIELVTEGMGSKVA